MLYIQKTCSCLFYFYLELCFGTPLQSESRALFLGNLFHHLVLALEVSEAVFVDMDFDEDRQELGKYGKGLDRGHLTVCNYCAIKIGGDEVEDVMVVGQKILLKQFLLLHF